IEVLEVRQDKPPPPPPPPSLFINFINPISSSLSLPPMKGEQALGFCLDEPLAPHTY
ncbi:hypothetical protein A2U01_0093391, partial [Trifolium medium]|nr:hypothetical protein [Trifolium medium]